MNQPENCFALAIDIGGSKLDIGLINTDGRLLESMEKFPVPFDQSGIADPYGLISLIAPYVEKSSGISGHFCGIGLSVCGNIDTATGEAVLVPNLHWRNMPFGRMVADHFDVRVVSATDVRMAALAEAVWGVAREVQNFAWATVGTGYGGYLFLNGRLYGGSHGFAGNFGHFTLDEINGFLCGCGRKGCFETFVAGPAIARAGQNVLDQGGSQILCELAQGKPVTPRMVFQAEDLGDQAAHDIIEQVIRLISINLGGLVNILDLDMIVLGGGVAHATQNFITRVDRRIRDYMETVEAIRDLRVVAETFSNSALYGAAVDLFIREKILQIDPFD